MDMKKIFETVNTSIFIGGVLISFVLGVLANPILTNRDKELDFYRNHDITTAYNIVNLQDSIIMNQKNMLSEFTSEAMNHGFMYNIYESEEADKVYLLENKLDKIRK